MTQLNHTRRLALMEEAITVLFCLVDDAYAHLNPNARRYESLKRLSDSEVITLALFQQLRGTESQRSFLRDTERFFSHLFPGIAGLHPSSLNRRFRKLRRRLELLRRDVVDELVGEPETLIVDSTLLQTNDRQAFQETFEKVAFRGCESLAVTVPVEQGCICLPQAEPV
jgi:thiazole synthase ThiGH ThiG subunit